MRLPRFLQQLLPFSYHSVYQMGGKWHYTRWRMFLGRCFAVRSKVLD